MSDAEQTAGVGGLARLAEQVLHEWREGPGAAAEELEICEDCGGFVDDAIDAETLEMVEQWTAATGAGPVGPVGHGTGWVWGAEGFRGGGLGGLSTGWPGVRDEDL